MKHGLLIAFFAFIAGIVCAALCGLPERITNILIPALLLLLFFGNLIIGKRLRSKQEKSEFRYSVHGFIRGFMLAAPRGYVGDIIHIADVELDRVQKYVDQPPELSTDPFYYAVNYADFGLSCVKAYADKYDIDSLREYCQPFENEVKRPFI